MHKCFDGSCKNCAKWDVGTHAHLWSSNPPVRPSFKIWSTYTKFDQEAVVLPFLFFTNLQPWNVRLAFRRLLQIEIADRRSHVVNLKQRKMKRKFRRSKRRNTTNYRAGRCASDFQGFTLFALAPLFWMPKQGDLQMSPLDNNKHNNRH